MGLYSMMRNLWVGERPPRDEVLTNLPYVDRDPRGLTTQDYEDFMSASERRAGMATWSQINWVLNHLKKSDPVRVWRIRKDMAWVAKKAMEMGVEWDDL